ncbi:unnamed protein product, partial [Mesorhabditis belari]|uniref:Uncharacterized protein n=1 Tax=Mesorhabditis belari TaxID=2138241 RepID=A0AAF3J9X3_9BILA
MTAETIRRVSFSEEPTRDIEKDEDDELALITCEAKPVSTYLLRRKPSFAFERTLPPVLEEETQKTLEKQETTHKDEENGKD